MCILEDRATKTDVTTGTFAGAHVVPSSVRPRTIDEIRDGRSGAFEINPISALRVERGRATLQVGLNDLAAKVLNGNVDERTQFVLRQNKAHTFLRLCLKLDPENQPIKEGYMHLGIAKGVVYVATGSTFVAFISSGVSTGEVIDVIKGSAVPDPVGKTAELLHGGRVLAATFKHLEGYA